MKRLTRNSLAVLLLSLAHGSFSAEPPARPPGVTAENWIAVSDRLGIVVLPSSAPADIPRNPAPVPGGQALLLKPPVGGYFMVKLAGGWTRLVVVEPVKGPADVG